jgi:hypothetical protein
LYCTDTQNLALHSTLHLYYISPYRSPGNLRDEEICRAGEDDDNDDDVDVPDEFEDGLMGSLMVGGARLFISLCDFCSRVATFVRTDV